MTFKNITIDGILITKKESQVISCLLNGKRTKSIASLLNISPYTVISHIRNIMVKLNISSQDQLIKCIEASESYIKLKNLYFEIRLHDIFSDILQNLKNEISSKNLSCRFFIQKKDENINQLLDYIRSVGIKADIRIKQDTGSLDDNLITNIKKVYFEGISSPNEFENNIKNVILCEKREDQNNKAIYSICNETTDNYYYAVLKLIEKICDMESVNEIINKFKHYISFSDQNLRSQNSSEKAENYFEYYRKNILHFITGAIVITLTFVYNLISNNQNVCISNIQGLDFNSIIYREDMINQMDAIINKQKGTRYLILTGEAGIGKTTLSKIYGTHKYFKLSWLINAETEHSIKNSFIDLANSLAAFGSSSLKESLLYIKSIKDKQEMFNQLLLFVFKNLESIKNWYIIFDNVDDFNKINNYLPRNPNDKGTIVITSRNFSIYSYLGISKEDHLKVNYLTEKEQFDLFGKVCQKKNFNELLLKDIFEKIPSTPLDVSILANYLNNIEFNNDKLTKINSISMQKIYKNELYKPINYPYTRYKLMEKILKKIMRSNHDFKDLLLMLGVLDSQNIPKSFFVNLKNNTIADEFIFNLRKFSILTIKNNLLSIHRNLQKIIQNYMFNLIPYKQVDFLIGKITDSLTDYNFIRLIASHSEISGLLPHVNSLIKVIKNSNLPNKEKYTLRLNVSKFFIYNDIRSNKDIINFAENSLLPNLNKGYINDYEKVLLLNDLIYNYLMINEKQKAQNIIEKCQRIYDKFRNSKFSGPEVITLSYSANTEENIKEAERYFEKALIKLKNCDDLWRDTATAIVYYQYYSFCFNNFVGRKTFEKTTDIMENFLKLINCNGFFYKKYKQKQYKGELPFFVPGIRYRLAGMYNILELYTKALECIYEVKYFYKDRRNKGNLSLGLESDLDIEYGYTLLRLNKTVEAYNILKKALEVKMKIRDKHDLFRGFVYLSETCLRLKKYNEFYKICKECIPQDSCKYDKLLYLHYLYNIFIAQYKTNSNKIIDSFRNFFNYSKRIYHLFLNPNNIKELNNSSIGLDSCLEYCRKMFIAIYGQEHSFVKNYLVKN